eukprot:TRINITY_DN467_c0_g1_i1.p1 TRINITY_DN467_c0_g1~~TRINITY_DN467_c0_g1_i1.p1  ORF type:complete len:344 (+),score=-146.91 TRINITY_DN467_c0_g1_i1:40-1071(+)
MNFYFLTKEYFNENKCFHMFQNIYNNKTKNYLTTETLNCKILIITHVWETKEDPDPFKYQFQNLKIYLENTPEETIIFYDFSCLPQKNNYKINNIPKYDYEIECDFDLGKYFSERIQEMNKLYSGECYLSSKVLNLNINGKCLKRAWPYFELFYSCLNQINVNSNSIPGSLRKCNEIRLFVSENKFEFSFILKWLKEINYKNFEISFFEKEIKKIIKLNIDLIINSKDTNYHNSKRILSENFQNEIREYEKTKGIIHIGADIEIKICHLNYLGEKIYKNLTGLYVSLKSELLLKLKEIIECVLIHGTIVDILYTSVTNGSDKDKLIKMIGNDKEKIIKRFWKI